MSVPALEGPLGSTLFEVIKGAPTPEELAVVTALLTALSTTGSGGKAPKAAPAASWDRPDAVPPASWMARA